ncbi:hypothetical protein [Pseudobutyrivibrio ruminis]|uniref:Membrane protein 6-pyruvoyl-tetrahydropterin synthase-related domain-containing protein n=1 Tax=Pseudobutyrivibrio ruminis DSM 9787 TaxID=1123011 RepID=A0A285SA25_9FIRM|nr:hypothetical protein [Pseudobutyrivibrio ruminis]SOC04125.1 hypothetical protein SAMN02910411_2015 [Pseudobutyrivibrio ruminis DSM 9787]
MKKLLDRNRICITIALLALVFIASLPAFRSGIYQGHDLDFHLGRIQAIAQELQKGQFPVRYESEAWYGHGYVSTTFYGNIFLYIPAFMYLTGLPVWRAYNIYVLLVNVATVLVGFYSFKGIYNSRKWSLIATTLYTLSGYRLSNLYVRTALGEYTAMIFVPLVAYGIYRIYGKKDDRRNNAIKLTMPLIIGTTGLIESHILTTEIVAVFVFIFAIVNFKRTILVIKELLIALLAVLGLNAFFLVPFISSYSSMKLYINGAMTQTSIEGDGLYLSQIFGLVTIGRGSNWPWSTDNEGFLNLGLLTVLCFVIIAITIIITLVKKDWIAKEHSKYRFKLAMTMFGFGLISAWISSVYFPWNLFAGEGTFDKLMSSVQYPWRYSMFQTFFFVVAAVYCLKLVGTKLSDRTDAKIVEFNLLRRIDKFSMVVLTFVGLVALATTAVFDYTLSYGNITVNYADAPADWADNLYLPDGTDRGLLENTDASVDKESGRVTVPVLAYNNLHVYDESGNELEWTAGDNNCIQTMYDGDANNLTVKFVEPIGWRFSEVISLLSLVAVIILYKSKRKAEV